MARMFGRDFLALLGDALGLQGMPVQKIVIEASMDDAVKVYIRTVPPTEQTNGVLDAVRTLDMTINIIPASDLHVSDKGEVAALSCADEPFEVIMQPGNQPRRSV